MNPDKQTADAVLKDFFLFSATLDPSVIMSQRSKDELASAINLYLSSLPDTSTDRFQELMGILDNIWGELCKLDRTPG